MTVRYMPQLCRWGISKTASLVHLPFPASEPIQIELAELNAWTTRDEFLALAGPAEVLAFLARTGVFYSDAEAWTFDEIGEFQRVIQRLLAVPPNEWRLSMFRSQRVLTAMLNRAKYRVEFSWAGDSHAAAVGATSTLEALLATIHIDQLRGARFAFCARTACGKQFEIKSAHGQKYCSLECASAESSRKYRERRARRRSKGGQDRPSRSA
jgi:hypothetical protein